VRGLLQQLRATVRAMPTLFRVGIAETVAYRAEFIVWMLTTTQPLVMLGLWTSVAREKAFQDFGPEDFVAYYLATLLVRNLTGSWVVWQINDEVRRGVLSMRLLRPIHPFASYVATHLSAVPLRALIAMPVAILLLVTSAREALATDPGSLALLPAALVGAWFLTFFTMVMIGTMCFYIEKSMSLFEIYLGLFSLLSGYLLPLALMPGWVQQIAAVAPFRYMLSLPVEIITDAHHGDLATMARLVAIQWAYAALVVTAALALWRRGVRRFEAYGA
jgi:viologen exporter family transport system permease protein